jgi:hypothetical protein
MATDFTRIILPDGSGRTVEGELGFQVGEVIHTGQVADWPQLDGYRVVLRRQSVGGRRDSRGIYRSGSCTELYVRLSRGDPSDD